MKISKKTDLETNRGGIAISHPGYAGVQVLTLKEPFTRVRLRPWDLDSSVMPGMTQGGPRGFRKSSLVVWDKMQLRSCDHVESGA